MSQPCANCATLTRERDELQAEFDERFADYLDIATRCAEALRERDEARAALCLLREAATEAKEYLDYSAPVGSDEWTVRQRLDVALHPESVGALPLPKASSASRDERCASCGRPTYVGEDFDGPCVHDSDLECALHELKAAHAEVDGLASLGPPAKPVPLSQRIRAALDFAERKGRQP